VAGGALCKRGGIEVSWEGRGRRLGDEERRGGEEVSSDRRWLGVRGVQRGAGTG